MNGPDILASKFSHPRALVCMGVVVMGSPASLLQSARPGAEEGLGDAMTAYGDGRVRVLRMIIFALRNAEAELLRSVWQLSRSALKPELIPVLPPLWYPASPPLAVRMSRDGLWAYPRRTGDVSTRTHTCTSRQPSPCTSLPLILMKK